MGVLAMTWPEQSLICARVKNNSLKLGTHVLKSGFCGKRFSLTL